MAQELRNVQANMERQSANGDGVRDITGDGFVSVEDLLVVLSNWGGSGSADINEDGTVDVMDLLGVVAAWGECD